MLSDNAGSFATLLLAVITLSTAAGVGFQRGKIGQLRGELAEERERRVLQGEELREARDEIATARAETEQVRTDLAAVSRVVTGEAHWVAIGALLDEHHQESLRRWGHMEDTLERIATATERRPT